MLLLFISLEAISLLILGILGYYLHTIRKDNEELRVKLKITTSFADNLSKRLIAQNKVSSDTQAEDNKPYRKTRRSPKKRSDIS